MNTTTQETIAELKTQIENIIGTLERIGPSLPNPYEAVIARNRLKQAAIEIALAAQKDA